MPMHMYVWSDRNAFLAVAQAATVAQARALLLSGDLGESGDGSCPERDAARALVTTTMPEIWHGPSSEFVLTDSAEQREQCHYSESLRARLAEVEAERDAANIALNDAQNKLSAHPSNCPVTGRPFFMVIEDREGNMVATYGGPFDSYTIPEWSDDEFRSERYDHDGDYWVEGGEPYPFVRVDEDFLNGHIATLQIIDGHLNEAGVATEFEGKKIDLDDRVQILMEQRDEAKAGEARAVEALKNLRPPLYQLGDFMYGAVRECSQDLIGIVDSVLGDVAVIPALTWLAEQRAEAAAAELEGLEQRWQADHSVSGDTKGIIQLTKNRAAALRAGAKGEKDAE